MSALKIAMLGLGEMNGAILKGALSSGVLPGDIAATTRSIESAAAASEEFGIQVVASSADVNANIDAVKEADLIFLGVLPTGIVDLCGEIRDATKAGAVVVSVAAGVPLQLIESALKSGQSAIRTMPNTPLSVGLGVVGMTPGRHATESEMQSVASVFEPSGSVHVIDESKMDALNAITGSGPGYLYYLAEQVAAAGVQLGFDVALSNALTAQMLLGASTILSNASKTDPDAAATLRASMWLPGGTTAQAYEVFDQHEMAVAIRQGVKGSAGRSTEIAAELSSAR